MCDTHCTCSQNQRGQDGVSERERERVGQITRKLASPWKTSETRENTEEAKYVLMPDEGKHWKPKKTWNSNMCPPTNREKIK